MQLDFQYNGVRYMLNFEDVLCKEYAPGVKAVELRIYDSLAPDSLYGSSLKVIKNNKIVWHEWDNTYLPKDTQSYCDRMVKLMIFA